MLRSRVWRPGFCAYASRSPGRLGPPPAPIARWGLPWMAGRGRTEGRRNGRLDRGEVAFVCPDPEGGPRGETPPVERRKARLPLTRQAGAFKGCPVFCAFRRSAPSFEGARRKGAAPAPKLTPGADESRLWDFPKRVPRIHR